MDEEAYWEMVYELAHQIRYHPDFRNNHGPDWPCSAFCFALALIEDGEDDFTRAYGEGSEVRHWAALSGPMKCEVEQEMERRAFF